MGSKDKRIEQLKQDLEKLHNKVVKAKKFTKKKDWKQFRANVNKPPADRSKSADVTNVFKNTERIIC